MSVKPRAKKTTKKKTVKRTGTTYEYQIIPYPLDDDILMRAQVDPEARVLVNQAIQEELNKYGKQGWKLHSIGANSFVIERESN